MNVRVEYESTPIRHIAVQCPKCQKWFCGWDIVKGERAFDNLRYEHDIRWVEFECPVCGEEFGGMHNREQIIIQEVGSAEECYKNCLNKKEVWE